MSLRQWIRFDSGEKGLSVKVGILLERVMIRARGSVFLVRCGFEGSLGKIRIGLLGRRDWVWNGLGP